MSNARRVKRSLKNCINEVSLKKDLYCYNPVVDFSRDRKLTFSEMLKAILFFSGKSLNKELLEIFGCKSNIACICVEICLRQMQFLPKGKMKSAQKVRMD